MMHFALAALSVALIVGAGTASAQEITHDSGAAYVTPQSIPLPMNIGGRVHEGVFTKETPHGKMQGTAYVHQWPGLYFEAAFTGPEVLLRFNDSANLYSLIIDNGAPMSIARPGEAEYRVAGLDPARRHTVRLEKNTESQDKAGEFHGFFVPKGSTPLTPLKRQRAMEFIGDSFTAGYGNTSAVRDCPGEGVWATTDTQQAWGPLVARHYDADYRVNAYSGFGIVRNYNGVAPRRSLVKFYPYALFDEATPADDSAWHPQIIVIALGGNDFSTPVHAGDRWADEDALTNDYITTYVSFVQSLRATHPAARFIVLSYGEERVKSALAVILERLKASGENRAAMLDVGSNFALTGCDWHLNLDDDRKVAAAVESFLDQHSDYWPDY